MPFTISFNIFRVHDSLVNDVYANNSIRGVYGFRRQNRNLIVEVSLIDDGDFQPSSFSIKLLIIRQID